MRRPHRVRDRDVIARRARQSQQKRRHCEEGEARRGNLLTLLQYLRDWLTGNLLLPALRAHFVRPNSLPANSSSLPFSQLLWGRSPPKVISALRRSGWVRCDQIHASRKSRKRGRSCHSEPRSTTAFAPVIVPCSVLIQFYRCRIRRNRDILVLP